MAQKNDDGKTYFYVEYSPADGAINSTNGPHDYAPPTPANGRKILRLSKWQDTNGKRVNHTMQVLEDCPIWQKNQHNGDIQRQIDASTAEMVHALAEFHVTGDKGALEGLHNKVKDLKTKFRK